MFRTTVICAAAVLLAATVSAQQGQPEMTPEQKAEMEAYAKAGTPGPAHKKLAESVGSFSVAAKSWADATAQPTMESGSATRKMILEGRVLVEDYSGTMLGLPFTGQGLHGFDNVSGKYWATWMDNWSTGMMMSEGTCDASDVCKYTGTYNDPIKKKPVTLRMQSRWTSPTTQVFEMWAPGKDGKDFKMMELTYTKK